MKNQTTKAKDLKTETRDIGHIIIPLISVIVVLLIIIFGAIFINGNAGAKVNTPPPGKTYYDLYVESGGKSLFSNSDTTKELINKMKAQSIEPDKETVEMIKEVKQKIKDEYGKYDFLEWSRFENVKISSTTLSSKSINALYDKDENVIYAVNANQKDAEETIAHELIHALTTNDLIWKSAYYEGFTEYLALRIYPKEGGSYIHAVVFAEAYVENYGLEKALKDYISGTVTNDINAKIGVPGIAEEIEPAIWSVSRGNLDAFYEAVIIETYARYLNATSAQPSEKSSKLFLLLGLSKGYSEEMYEYLGQTYIPKNIPSNIDAMVSEIVADNK